MPAPTRYPAIRPIETLSRVTVGVLALAAVPFGIEVISSVSWLAVSRGLHGDLANLGETEARVLDGLDAVAVFGGALTWLAAAVVFIVWLFRARGNVDAFDRYIQRWGRPWLFFGWIVPFANLVIPRRIIGDLWIGGNPGDENARRHGSTPLIDWWWGFFLFSWFMSMVYGKLEPQNAGDFDQQAYVGVIDGAVGVIAAVLAARIVLGIDRGLREQAAGLASQPG